MTQQLRSLTAFTEGSGSCPRTHMVVHSSSSSEFDSVGTKYAYDLIRIHTSRQTFPHENK